MNLYAIEKHKVSNKMMGLHSTDQSYVVAFRSSHTAKYVASKIHKMPRLVLNTDVNQLTIYKNSNLQLVQPSFDIVEYMFDDLVIHPFKNCVGLILPLHIIKEDELHFVFESIIIHPCSDDVCAMMKYGIRNDPRP